MSRRRKLDYVDGVLTAKSAFYLWDTCGFPVEMTEEILREKGLTLDRAGFDALLNEQRERSRANTKKRGLLG